MRNRKVQSRESSATTVDRVPRSSVHTSVDEDMCVLQSAWCPFCSEAHGVYIIEEDGAWIGQPGRETVRYFLRHARSEVVLPAALPHDSRRTGKLLQGCVARAQNG